MFQSDFLQDVGLTDPSDDMDDRTVADLLIDQVRPRSWRPVGEGVLA